MRPNNLHGLPLVPLSSPLSTVSAIGPANFQAHASSRDVHVILDSFLDSFSGSRGLCQALYSLLLNHYQGLSPILDAEVYTWKLREYLEAEGS